MKIECEDSTFISLFNQRGDSPSKNLDGSPSKNLDGWVELNGASFSLDSGEYAITVEKATDMVYFWTGPAQYLVGDAYVKLTKADFGGHL